MFAEIREIAVYGALFGGLYFQVFLFLSYFFPNKDGEEYSSITDKKKYEPSVGIIVPCWNEEHTVEVTVNSLLALDYPREKLHIAIVNDGSTDATWDIIQQYKDNPSVHLMSKENEGSKFAALNFGLAYLRSHVHPDVIGCLDADSTVDPHALRASMRAFCAHDAAMAVMPAMTIDRPESVWQYMQKVEYEMMTFGKQVFHNLKSIFVAPGPFALFKREVFDKLGPYKEAYHTEDLEICLRMIMNRMKIVFASDARVYTRGPRTFSALIKQRVRWIYGFVKNVHDYRSMLFTSKYGHISLLILPVSLIGIWSLLFIFPSIIVQLGFKGYDIYEKFSITGIHASQFSLFYVNTQPYLIMTVLFFVMLLTTIFLGRSILRHKRFVTLDLLTFALYSYTSMYWTTKALVNALRSKKSTWR